MPAETRKIEACEGEAKREVKMSRKDELKNDHIVFRPSCKEDFTSTLTNMNLIKPIVPMGAAPWSSGASALPSG